MSVSAATNSITPIDSGLLATRTDTSVSLPMTSDQPPDSSELTPTATNTAAPASNTIASARHPHHALGSPAHVNHQQQDEQRRRESRKQLAFRLVKRLQRPEFQQRRRVEQRGHVGAEPVDLAEIALKAERRVNPPVRPQQRDQRQRGDRPRGDDVAERPDRSTATARTTAARARAAPEKTAGSSRSTAPASARRRRTAPATGARGRRRTAWSPSSASGIQYDVIT